jgi:hypothetical protein
MAVPAKQESPLVRVGSPWIYPWGRCHIEETRLPPLAPEAGAAIWRRLGFEDVPEVLLQQASVRCGGNPWLIELRASTLQRASLAFPAQGEPVSPPSTFSKGSEEQKQAHVRERLLEHLLKESRLFMSGTDFEARDMLQEVLNAHLSQQAYALLEILALSPVPLAFAPLRELQVEEAFAELQHASLVDVDTKVYANRAQLLPLVVEAVIHRLEAEGRVEVIEDLVIEAYTSWLKQGIQSDQEKSVVVAELIAFSLERQRLLDAAERLLRYSWLLSRFGHATRIARLVRDVMENMNWRSTPEQECGGLPIPLR